MLCTYILRLLLRCTHSAAHHSASGKHLFGGDNSGMQLGNKLS